MITKQGSWYTFTANDLSEEGGVTKNAVRFRLSKLTGSGSVKLSHTLRPTNQKVYVSLDHPLSLLEAFNIDRGPRIANSFWNNPFNLTNAIDWRNRYEEIFN